MPHFDWSTLAEEVLNPQAARRVLHTDRMTVARLALKAGAVVPTHHHDNEQISMVVSGRLIFVTPDARTEVSTGQIFVVPSMVPHSVECLDDTDVIDLFAPGREDWKRGDDAYLRGGSSGSK